MNRSTTSTTTTTTTNKCHRRYESLSPVNVHCPAAPNSTTPSTTATTNLRRNRETWVKTTTCCPRTRKVLEASMASRLLLVLFCLLCPVVANPSAEPTLLQQQQQQQSQGGPLPFPEGNFDNFFRSVTLSTFFALDILIFLALSLCLSPTR